LTTGKFSVNLNKKDMEHIVNRTEIVNRILLKISESKENGDGEVPHSAYWYRCGLFDALTIFDEYFNNNSMKEKISECTECGLIVTDSEKVKIHDPEYEGMTLLVCPKCCNKEFYLKP
jgi:hypothetical protein